MSGKRSKLLHRMVPDNPTLQWRTSGVDYINVHKNAHRRLKSWWIRAGRKFHNA